MLTVTRSRVVVGASIIVLLATLSGCGVDAQDVTAGAPVMTTPNTHDNGFASSSDRDDDTAATTEQETTTTLAATTTTVAAGITDPDAAARRILLRSSDVPSLTDLGEPLHEGTHTTDECKYLSASPWVANVTGRNFTPDGGRSAYFSQVVIEPTDADIAAIRATASDDGFQQRCILPSEHSAVQDSLTEANAQTPCGLSLTSEALTPVPADHLDPGVVGWSYHAVIHCDAENSDSDSFSTSYLATVGRVAIQLRYVGYGAPDMSIVNSALSNMLARAQQEQKG